MDVSTIKANTEVNKVNNSYKKNSEYGKTIGEPKLSDEAKDYYEKLKEKFNGFDFILVDKDSKDYAMANSARYANPLKTVVLIDEEKIEKMATDEEYRKKYESILTGAKTSLAQMEKSLKDTGSNVAGFGIKINDNGTASYFAVLKEASNKQKERIEAKAEEKNKKRIEERKEAREDRAEKIIEANSLDELLKKIQDYQYEERENVVRTEAELNLGQRLDIHV